MPYNFVADSFHTNKLCSRLSSSEVRIYSENGRFAFLSPLKGLGATAPKPQNGFERNPTEIFRTVGPRTYAVFKVIGSVVNVTDKHALLRLDVEDRIVLAKKNRFVGAIH